MIQDVSRKRKRDLSDETKDRISVFILKTLEPVTIQKPIGQDQLQMELFKNFGPSCCNKRQMRSIIAQLRKKHLIGFSTREMKAGYFMIHNEEELNAVVRHYMSRAYTEIENAKKLRDLFTQQFTEKLI